MLRAAILLVGALCLARPASARQVPVASATALRSACQAALPGDSILIAPGTYTWSSGLSRILVKNRPGPVLVRGITGLPADVVVRGAGQDSLRIQMIFNLDDCPRWTFEAITTSATYYHGFKFDHGSTDCALRNVVMRDHGESGVKGTSDPGSGRYPDRLLVEHCDIGFTSPAGGTRSVVEGVDGIGVNDWVIRRNRFVNIQKGGGPAYAAFTKGNASNTLVDGNVFEDCFIGASFGGGGTGAGYFRDFDTTYEHRGGIIRNNIVIRSSDAAVYVNKGRDCKVYNNTVFECAAAIQLRFTESTGWVRNNLVKRPPSNPSQPLVELRNGATALANEANLAATDADFILPAGSPSSLDLHLHTASSKIDAGVAVGTDVPTDVDGAARPAGAGFDVGADEWATPTDASQPRDALPGTLIVLPRFVRRGSVAEVLLEGSNAGPCTVFDAAGRRVMAFVIPPDARSYAAPVGRLPVGTYWLQVGKGASARAGRVVVVP